MADTQVQRRRGTTPEHAAFIGAEGEITVDTTKKTAVVHDGATAGGYPLLKEALLGVANGVASLDPTGKVPLSQIPISGVSTAYGYRNVLLNPNFTINQDVVSGTVILTAGQYGHDGWKAGSSGCTYTFAKVDNVTVLTISAGSLMQVIEGINLRSALYYLTWVGTATGKIAGGSYAASGVTGIATGGTNMQVEFSTGTLSLVQCERGEVTPFEFRPIQLELFFAMRYYEKTHPQSQSPTATTTIANQICIANLPSSVTNSYSWASQVYKVTKRSAPTIILRNAAGIANTANNDLNASYITNGATPVTINEAGFTIANSAASPMALSYGTAYFNWVANARL